MWRPVPARGVRSSLQKTSGTVAETGRKRKDAAATTTTTESLLDACKKVALSRVLELLAVCGCDDPPGRTQLKRAVADASLERALSRCDDARRVHVREWLTAHSANAKKQRSERKDANAQRQSEIDRTNATLDAWRDAVWKVALRESVLRYLAPFCRMVQLHEMVASRDNDGAKSRRTFPERLRAFTQRHPEVTSWPFDWQEPTEYQPSSELVRLFGRHQSTIGAASSSSSSSSSFSASPCESSPPRSSATASGRRQRPSAQAATSNGHTCGGATRWRIPLTLHADTSVAVRERDSEFRSVNVSLVRTPVGTRWATLELCERGTPTAADSAVSGSDGDGAAASIADDKRENTLTMYVRLAQPESVRLAVSLSHERNDRGTIVDRIGPTQLLRFELDFGQHLMRFPGLAMTVAYEHLTRGRRRASSLPALADSVEWPTIVGSGFRVRGPELHDMPAETETPLAAIPRIVAQLSPRNLLAKVHGNAVSFAGDNARRLVEQHGFTPHKVGRVYAAIDLELLFVQRLCAEPLPQTHLPDVLCQCIIEYVTEIQ